MNRADPPPRSVDLIDGPSNKELDDELSAEEALDEEEEEDEVEVEAEMDDDLSDTGIDLSDASELDADNVPADEEFDRVMQAPD